MMQPATKIIKITKLPEYLVIVLKRFDEVSSSQDGIEKKDIRKVKFPNYSLKMNPYCCKDSVDVNTSDYQIYGSVVHTGDTCSGDYSSYYKINPFTMSSEYVFHLFN